jgi:hypothetical protein
VIEHVAGTRSSAISSATTGPSDSRDVEMLKHVLALIEGPTLSEGRPVAENAEPPLGAGGAA